MDDEIPLLEQAKHYLERTDLVFMDTATSAKDALALRDLLVYDVIVSDYRMPDMDGIAFLKEIRSRSCDTPFIIFTGKGREEVVIEAINNGADFYIQKGDDIDSQFAELIHKIRMAIQRKEFEKDLRESEERYRNLVENSIQGLTIIQDGRPVYANPALYSITGFSNEEFLSLTSEQLLSTVHPDDRERIKNVMENRIAGGEFPHENEYRIITKNGETHWVITHGTRIMFNGAPAIQLAYFNITDRKLAEEALRKSEARYRDIYENAVIGIYTVTPQGRFLSANKKAAQILGYESPGELIQSITSIDTQIYADPARRDEAARLLKQQGFIENFEAPCRHKNGSIVWVSFNAKVIRDENGNVIGHEGTSQDITDKKKTEQALLESQAQLQLALAGSETGMWELDLSRMTGSIDDRAAAILGYRREDIGTTVPEWDALSHPDDVPLIQQRLADYIQGKSPIFESEHRMRTKDGDWKWVVGRGKITSRAKDGTPLRISGTLHDTSERRTIEESVRRVNRKLNVLSQLTRKDLNNQIIILTSYIHLLKHQLTGKDSNLETLSKIESAVHSIQAINEHTRDYQDMGAKPPAWQNVKTAMLLGMSHISIGDIHHSIETEDLEIYADPLLEKVCQQLFENSFVHGGHVTRIRVSYCLTPDGVSIVFEDDGAGIPREKKDLLFIRGGGSYPSRNSLIFVKEILDITGIGIRETGEPGKGARFEITVPKGMYRITGS